MRLSRTLAVASATVAASVSAAAAAGPDLGATQQSATNWEAIIIFLAFVLLTLGITYRAARSTRSAADFYAAGGGISPGQNALAIARRLEEHDGIERVYYPGLESHPGHELASRQMSGFGGMLSFRLRGGEEAALAVCDRAQVFTLAESLGGVESLVEHPHRMTHASVAGSALEVPADLVRLSVGIEYAEDLLADLDQMLA